MVSMGFENSIDRLRQAISHIEYAERLWVSRIQSDEKFASARPQLNALQGKSREIQQKLDELGNLLNRLGREAETLELGSETGDKNQRHDRWTTERK